MRDQAELSTAIGFPSILGETMLTKPDNNLAVLIELYKHMIDVGVKSELSRKALEIDRIFIRSLITQELKKGRD